MARKIEVKAGVIPGMILVAKPTCYSRTSTVWSIMVVTAVGSSGICALNTDGGESYFSDSTVTDQYDCFGYMWKEQDLLAYEQYFKKNNWVCKRFEVVKAYRDSVERNGTL